jgi:hypothetical protein
MFLDFVPYTCSKKWRKREFANRDFVINDFNYER